MTPDFMTVRFTTEVVCDAPRRAALLAGDPRAIAAVLYRSADDAAVRSRPMIGAIASHKPRASDFDGISYAAVFVLGIFVGGFVAILGSLG